MLDTVSQIGYVDEESENGVVVFIRGVYLDGPVASDDNQDGDSTDYILIYEREEEDTSPANSD